MIKESVTLDETLEFLNSLIEIDNKAISYIIGTHHLCNEELANHPTVQVRENITKDSHWYSVGALGILNGLFGINDKTGWGGIVAVFDGDTLLRFEIHD